MKGMTKRMAMIFCLVVFWEFMYASKDVAGAEAPADFFQGKTVTIFTSNPGSSTDLLTRIIAPFLAKETGAKVKVEDRKTDEIMNYLYRQGSRDGLTLGTKNKDAMIGNDILKAPGVQYETDKFNFVADVYPSMKIFQISPKLPYKTLEALRKAKGLRAGASSAKGSLALSGAVMLEILGLDGKVITGFKGKQEVVLAMARGEVDCMVPGDDTALGDEKAGYLVNLVTAGNKRSVAVPQIPSLSDLGVKVPKELAAVQTFVSSGGTALALPPGVPPERVEYMRKILLTLSNNKELQNALEKVTGDRRPFITGQELQEEMIEIKSDKELVNKLDAIFRKYTALR